MESPIEHIRAQAKRLKKDFHSGTQQAKDRLKAFLPDKANPKHSYFLHILARENGFASWPKLKHHHEIAVLNRDERADRLKMALYFGQGWMIDQLLGADPGLADHNLGLQIALYDLKSVTQAIADDASAATRKIGYRTPILHLAFSKYIHKAPHKASDMLAIAELLVAHGADVNDGFPPEPGNDHCLSALYGALGHADNMILASWLLDRGASPDDDESLYHATELSHHDGLQLLVRHGVRSRGTNALLRALDFDDVAAVRILLEHGADPNESTSQHPSGEPMDAVPALHQAARRQCGMSVAQLLLDYGAKPEALWKGHTPYGLACIYGNRAVADLLRDLGFASELTPLERALSDCAQDNGRSVSVEPDELGPETKLLLTRLASQSDRLPHLKRLVAAGLDPNQADEMGLTPLHSAGWHGLADHVAYFLTLDPDLSHRNAFGGDALGTIIHGAEFAPPDPASNYIRCARLLLEAGAQIDPQEIENTGSEEMAQFLEDWLDP